MATTAIAAAAIAIQPATEALNGYPLEERLKKTGYVALLLSTRFSPGTLPISSFIVRVGAERGGRQVEVPERDGLLMLRGIEGRASSSS
jgi:hypothetical protein